LRWNSKHSGTFPAAHVAGSQSRQARRSDQTGFSLVKNERPQINVPPSNPPSTNVGWHDSEIIGCAMYIARVGLDAFAEFLDLGAPRALGSINIPVATGFVGRLHHELVERARMYFNESVLGQLMAVSARTYGRIAGFWSR